MKRTIHILFSILCLSLTMSGCKEDLVSQVSQLLDDEGIKAGEPVLFSSYVPSGITRATDAETAFNTDIAKYKRVGEDYTFLVEMFQQPEGGSTTLNLLGSGTYQPIKTTTTDDEGITTTTYEADGELTATATPLYWPGNAKNYGFRATTVTADTYTFADQSTKEKFIAQDKLKGFGFEPLWNTAGDVRVDDPDTLNYRTSRNWYQANKDTKGMAPGSEDNATWYKKIPLYMQHQRSRITIRLKAGEGVEREKLANLANIETKIYSYPSQGDVQIVTPFGSLTKINYESSDVGGAAPDVPTTEYTCVVQPHDYTSNPTTEPIARISLSGQNFTFYASNDFLYEKSTTEYVEGESSEATDARTAAIAHMENYDISSPGKHLVIDATLGRGSRKILITAYVVDWVEALTESIVDDYGMNGDPVQIKSRQELWDFLKDPTKNKPGSVAIIVPNALNLETEPWSYNTDDATTNDFDLNCTLNLAGAVLRTNHRIFKNIGPSGKLVNGTISIGNTTVDAALATHNLGTIERVDVEPADANGNSSSGKATQAGLVVTNSGTILQCESHLPVEGTSGMVGGIAAYSIYSAENSNTMPVIDGCVVNANVDKAPDVTASVTGGGIVGEALGRVSNNTFTYGITLLQNATNFKNSIYSKPNSTYSLRAYGNSWPTISTSDFADDTNTSESKYDAVIDCQAELAAALESGYNSDSKHYRLSSDFAVTEWKKGTQTDIVNTTGATGNVLFKLDGDGHTITTDGMLFSNVQNDVKDLTVRLGGDLIATSSSGEAPTGTEPIAAFAYSVCHGATISNIQVKGGNYRIQAPTVAGLVVWAYGGATIENCQCKANLQVWIADNPAGRIYSGGIVANAEKAQIKRCVFHNTSGTLFRNKNTDYKQAGTITTDETSTTSDESDVTTENLKGIYFGGILGGISKKGTASTVTPEVLIEDCSSWFSTTGVPYKGAIVGFPQYATGSEDAFTTGLDQGCQGNWWNTSSQAIGTGIAGKTEEQQLGKRNAVAPTQNTHYED